MHSSAVLSLFVFLFAKSQLELVRVYRERPVGTTAQTAPQQARFGSDWTSAFFPLGNQEQRARVSHTRASLLNMITILRDRVVCQHISTIARREQDAPPPNSHQYVVVCLVHTAVVSTESSSAPASKKSPRLMAPAPSDNGSRKPARPYVRKDALLLRSMLL